MTKRNIPVYFEEFQMLVLCRLDSLIINLNKDYEYNQSNTNPRRSSPQRRLRGISQLVCRQCGYQNQRRWLQNSRAYLDELIANSALHRRDVRQHHTHQGQRQKSSPSDTTCVTNALHAKQSGDSISPFFSARGCFFPLATTLSTCHHTL